MRLRMALLVAALSAATLAGCAADPAADLDAPAATPLKGQQFEGDPNEGEPAGGSPRSHGQYQREDSAVEAGIEPTSVPGAYARKTVTITNDFGGSPRGFVSVSVDSGSIRVLPGNGGTYRIEAALEGRGLTPQDASDNLARIDIVHRDVMQADGLHLTTETQREPTAEVVPGMTINLGGSAWADVVVYLPAGPAYDLVADAGSGDIGIKDLRGPSFAASTGSGDILAQGLNAGELTLGTGSGDLTLDALEAARASLDTGSGNVKAAGVSVGKLVIGTGSGDIGFAGIVDTLEADSGSGSITIDAHGMRSGSYTLSAGSGDIDVTLLYLGGRAYRVVADAGSGDVNVDLPNSRTTTDDEDDSYVEAENRDFDEARIRTVVAIETGSGDINVQA